MRIGVDMFGNQEENRGRGVGRYTRQLVKQMLLRFPRHEYVLYYHEGLPGIDDPWPIPPTVRTIPRPACPQRRRTATDYLTRENPDELDVLLLSCAFDCYRTHHPPPRTAHGPQVACVLYDLIPALFPAKYLADEAASRSYHAALRTARQYDRFLAISEATRLDGIKVLALPEHRVTTIGTGSDGSFFYPDRSEPMPRAVARLLAAHGLHDPFIFCASAVGERKNLRGLLQAFQQLPLELRQSHQLLVTCAMGDWDRDFWQRVARELGILDRLVLIGAWPTSPDYLSDEAMRTFYQRCAAFVFPSLYEGFGLPILEALQCGAPVVAARNSSQPEVVGEAGLLANANDPADLAAKLTRVLSDAALAASLREKGPLQARAFTWEAVADRTMAAIEEMVDERRVGIAHQESQSEKSKRTDGGAHLRARRKMKPRIAFFSPFSPLRSGVVDYAERLLESLRDYYTIDLFHDAGYLPHAALAGGGESCHDYRLFSRFDRELNYAGTVYQMCNSECCGYIYETLQRFPGVVVMHDYALPEFHHWYAHTRGLPLEEFFARELMLENAELARELQTSFAAWSSEPGGLCRALLSRGLTVSRRILDHSASVLVHDEWGAGRLARALPDMAERVFVVPLGADVMPTPGESKAEIKRRLGFADDALILSCFGFINGMKYHEEAIGALAAIAKDYPSARLLFVGPDYTQGGAQAHAASLGVSGQVQFFGHTPMETYQELMAITDIGINLRRPPTRGETSAALMMLLGAGVATIITDVDAFSTFPDTVVRKVPPLSPGDSSLEQAVRTLAADEAARRRLGEAAREYVRTKHDWSKVAAQYAEAIEWTRENRHRWSSVVGQKTRALEACSAGVSPASQQQAEGLRHDSPAVLIQPATGTVMKRLIDRFARAVWRKSAGIRQKFSEKLHAEIVAAITPAEVRQAEAIADLNRLNEGLLREVLRLQSQVADLVRGDAAPPREQLLPLTATAPGDLLRRSA